MVGFALPLKGCTHPTTRSLSKNVVAQFIGQMGLINQATTVEGCGP